MPRHGAGYYVGGGAAQLLARRLAASGMGNPLRSLARVRDLCINLLRDVMSERGVQQRPLASTLQELLRICDVLNHHHQPAARELAAAIWRLYCALSQLEQAPIAGTIGEKTT